MKTSIGVLDNISLQRKFHFLCSKAKLQPIEDIFIEKPWISLGCKQRRRIIRIYLNGTYRVYRGEISQTGELVYDTSNFFRSSDKVFAKQLRDIVFKYNPELVYTYDIVNHPDPFGPSAEALAEKWMETQNSQQKNQNSTNHSELDAYRE